MCTYCKVAFVRKEALLMKEQDFKMLFLFVCTWMILQTKPVCGKDTGVVDPACKVNCACCKYQDCGPRGYFRESNCYQGCIEGYRGGRCIRKCDYPECAECPDLAYKCTKCKAGFYPGVSYNCTSKCPIGCKTCTSITYCTDCKDDYYSANGFKDCRYSYCPVNCICEQNACDSCKSGYYDISLSCTQKCPSNCVTCFSRDKCNTCSKGYFNGYEFDITTRLLLNNCSHECRENCITCSSFDRCLQCKPGKYGTTCQNDCSAGCENGSCQIYSGNCKCRYNFSGNNCTECVHGKFGSLCEKDCPMLCKNKLCRKSSGRCLKGCIANTVVGDTCNECVNGSYGEVCNGTCPKNCRDVLCDREGGECTYGCKENFSGKRCEACVNGNYGEACSLPCPKNCAGGKCNKTSGHCFVCSGNYYGNDCEDCAMGFYGSTCTDECSSQCLNSVCNRTTGTCELGCKGNYSGDKCCVESSNCQKCSSNFECSKCKFGYFGKKCNKTCSSKCSYSCAFVTGVCNSCKIDTYGPFCDSMCSSFCKKSQDKNNSSKCESKHGKCLYGCVDGFYGLNCNNSCSSQCVDKVCIQETGICSKGCTSNDPLCPLSAGQRSSDPEASITGPVVGGAVGLIVLIVAVIGTVFLYRRRLGKTESNRDFTEVSEPTSRQEHTYGNLTGREPKNNDLVTASSSIGAIGDVGKGKRKVDSASETDKTQQTNHKVNVCDLLTYITKEHVDSFDIEFMKLNKGLDLTKNCKFARRPENIKLNRYNEIYPYDHSRVTIPGQPGFFINACYIDGYSRKKAYIASLGPTAKTTDTFSTFWGMIWNEESDIIVMLTNLREASGMKCERYWPKAETETLYGQVKVKCRSVEVYAEYTIRTFTVSKGKDQRNILQLHYTAWPDKGVPKEVTSLIEFRQRVKTVPVILGGPVIVHCSAGVGRTGTYIALDQLTEEGKNEGSVDVFNCVKRMREQRVNMVQTAEQYEFLHKALVHSLLFGCEAMTAEEIQAILFEINERTFTNMYQTLREEVDLESEENIEARQENRKSFKHKNRRQADIPGDSSRVRLYLSRKDGQHDYINAVFINSFRIKDMFIATQSPLPGTVEDFLSMIYQQNSSCVVALEDPHNQNKDVGKYLPADNETYAFGNYTVMSSKCETTAQYVLKKLSIQNEKGEEKTVSHFQYKNWRISKKTPDSVENFVQFIKQVENCTHKQKEDTLQIVVHCLNGYERSGLFCVVYTLLEKLEAERQVSVVNTLRKVRTHRKQSITSVEQLKFCFQCISAYMEIYKTYSNFAT